MVYIKFTNGTGKTKKLHYPRKAGAIRAARKWEREWNPLKKWKVEGVYYEDGRLATTEYKPGFHEGLAKLLASI